MAFSTTTPTDSVVRHFHFCIALVTVLVTANRKRSHTVIRTLIVAIVGRIRAGARGPWPLTSTRANSQSGESATGGGDHANDSFTFNFTDRDLLWTVPVRSRSVICNRVRTLWFHLRWRFSHSQPTVWPIIIFSRLINVVLVWWSSARGGERNVLATQAAFTKEASTIRTPQIDGTRAQFLLWDLDTLPRWPVFVFVFVCTHFSRRR